MGGLVDRHSMPADRSSEKTSPSQPCLTPSIPSFGKKAVIGVGRMSQKEGGLLVLLPVEDRGGVAGAYEKSVSIGRKYGESWGWMRMVGFWYMGCGDATGVNIWLA
jgi:hypothetical protein